MLCLFLISSCVALKLSDPVSLRDASEENMSLQAWCAGTGCVMPFTPKSCLSWCDWNFDKQADAEARGAFAGVQWGKQQKKATDFGIILGKNTVVAKDMVTLYFMNSEKALNVDKNKYLESFAPTFPGGDAEQKLGDTILECKTCYIMQSKEAKDDAPVMNEFAVNFITHSTGEGSTVQLFKYDNENKCAATKLLYSFGLSTFAAGKIDKGRWVSNTASNDGGKSVLRKFVIAADTKTETDKCKTEHTDKREVRDKTCKDDNTGKNKKDGGKECIEKLVAAEKLCYTNAVKTTNVGFGMLGVAWPTCK